MGILKTKTLFATHADFLNDSTECQLLKKILAPQLAAEFTAAGHLMKRVNLGHKTPDEMVDVVFRSILITIEKTSPFYITSFCLHPPETREYGHGLLSQWRGYANGGFAIEFDEADLDRQTVLENEAFSHAGIKTERVHYHDHAKQVNLASFKGMAGATLLTIVGDHPELLAAFGPKRLQDFMIPFFEVVPFLKDDGFAEEKEYRSVTLCIRPRHRPDIDKRAVREVQFRVSARGNVVPYVTLFSDLPQQLAIKSIIIGPHHNQENQRKAVSLLLEQTGVDASIRLSDIPYREH